MKKKIAYLFKWLLVSTVIGGIAGSLSAFFLETLDLVTIFRNNHTWIIWLLPFAGLAVGFVYHRFGREVEAGNNLILDEIHEPQKTVPFRIVPLILGATWIAHLFGGSAGREGTAIQMGASAADQLVKKFSLSREERTTVLMAGMSAGFGSVFGVPLAGTLFGIEVISIGEIRFRRVFECLVASYAGFWTALAFGVHHSHFQAPLIPAFDVRVIGSVLIAGLLFGLMGRAFAISMHAMTRAFKRVIPYAPLRPFVGGLLVLAGYFALGTFRFAGLGVPVIEDSFHQLVPRLDFLYKSIFTVLTLSSGMKGGEVTPLLFIGATFGNTLSFILPASFSLLAALGFVAVFGGAANTPLACTLMAMETFGPGIGWLALLACFASWLTSGHHGIYTSQRISRYKPSLRPRLRR